MIDFRNEIPVRAFINAQIIEIVVNSPEFKKCAQLVMKRYGYEYYSYKYINPAHVISLLYCLIVVPKEIWVKKDDHPIYNKLESLRPLDLFNFDKKPKSFDHKPIYNLIHQLRNAVAHASFSIDGTQMIFWNKQNTFRVSITIGSLSKFISLVGAELANLRG